MNNFAIYSAKKRISDAEMLIKMNFNLDVSTEINVDKSNPNIIELGVYLFDDNKVVYSRFYNFTDFVSNSDTLPLKELIQFITKHKIKESTKLMLSQTEQEGWGWDKEDMSDLRKVVCFHKKEDGQFLCWHDCFDKNEAKRTTRTFAVQNFSIKKPI